MLWFYFSQLIHIFWIKKIQEKNGLCSLNYNTLVDANVSFVLLFLQDLPILQEHNFESAMLPLSTAQGEQTIPLPTHNLMFADGQLQPWDGH